MEHEFREFVKEGCELTRPNLGMFRLIYEQTKGQPCNGCAFNRDCEVRFKLRKKLAITPSSAQAAARETHSEIAARTGLTRRQVAKRLAAGEVL